MKENSDDEGYGNLSAKIWVTLQTDVERSFSLNACIWNWQSLCLILLEESLKLWLADKSNSDLCGLFYGVEKVAEALLQTVLEVPLTRMNE